MSLTDQLFDGGLVRFAPPDPERDAEVESRWTHDPEYMQLMEVDPVRPLSAEQIRKKYEAAEKESGQQFWFAVRTKADDRLAGFVKLDRIAWNHGNCRLTMGIGEADDRGKGYGSDTLKLILRFAFGELNLHRVGLSIFEYNEGAIRFFERHGFVVEVRQRQAIHRRGRRWDVVWMGLLRRDWEMKRER